MKKKFVDTNIFLRYLTADDRTKYGKCRNLLKSAIDGKVQLATSGMVIAELAWTLLSYYKVPKVDVVEKLSLIIGTDQIFIPDREALAETLVLYGRKNIDFIDAYNAVFMGRHGMSEIYSYDGDFDRIEGMERKEP